MELRIKEITFPEIIEFNFDELKQEITDRAKLYKGIAYTEEQIQDAKNDRAMLNKFVKALSDERIKVKKQCLQPYEAFEAKINELSKIVQEPIGLIDMQVKEFEEQKKREKQEEIIAYWESIDKPDFLSLAMIEESKWLNASVSMKSVQEAINAKVEQIQKDVLTLSNLPEFGFEATECYKSSLDINKALMEAKRMSDIAKAKAEQERLKAEAEAKKQAEELAKEMNVPEEVVKAVVEEVAEEIKQAEPERRWIAFQALLSVEDAKALKQFFEDRKINYKKA